MPLKQPHKNLVFFTKFSHRSLLFTELQSPPLMASLSSYRVISSLKFSSSGSSTPSHTQKFLGFNNLSQSQFFSAGRFRSSTSSSRGISDKNLTTTSLLFNKQKPMSDPPKSSKSPPPPRLKPCQFFFFIIFMLKNLFCFKFNSQVFHSKMIFFSFFIFSPLKLNPKKDIRIEQLLRMFASFV